MMGLGSENGAHCHNVLILNVLIFVIISDLQSSKKGKMALPSSFSVAAVSN